MQESITLLLHLLISFVIGSRHHEHPGHSRGPGVRQYKDFVFNKEDGFLRPVAMDTEPSLPEYFQTASETETDFTRFEAVPYSLEQLLRPNGHSVLDTDWSVNELPPVVHLHYVWIEETNRPISLPCWAPANTSSVEFDQTTFRSHKRTWYIGQGNTKSLSPASAFGYKTDPASGALLISPFLGLQAGHSVFTCLLSPDVSTTETTGPGISFTETHMLYYQTLEDTLHVPRGTVSLTLNLVMIGVEDQVPVCQLYSYDSSGSTCRESAWQQVRLYDPWSPNAGYRYFDNEYFGDAIVEALKSKLSETTKEFCRSYSCSSSLSISFAKSTQSVEFESLSIAGFYANHLKLSNETILLTTPIGEIPDIESSPATENRPGDSTFQVIVKMNFTNGMITCRMARALFEPDLGDFQHRPSGVVFEEEPFNPYGRMLTSHEFMWIKDRYTPDALKYRPTFCTSEKLDEDDFASVGEEAYYASSGYTIIFAFPSMGQQALHTESALIRFTNMLSSSSCETGVHCSAGHCKLNISYGGGPVSIIIPLPSDNGLYKPMEDAKDKLMQYVTIIVGPAVTRNFTTPDQNNSPYFQYVIVLRNKIRVADGVIEAVFKPCDGSVTTQLTDGSWIKVLNWPAYELVGPSVERARRAFEQLTKPCADSFIGFPYRASVHPEILDILPNNEKKIHFATSGSLCAEECEKWDQYPDVTLRCKTGFNETSEPCTHQYFVLINREVYELAKHALNWQYTAFAIQYCESDFLRIQQDSAKTIATAETLACNISGNVRSLSHVLKCPRMMSLEDLRKDMPFCQYHAYDEDMVHRHSVSQAKISLIPVVKTCSPESEPMHQGANEQVYRLTYNERGCPIGYRRERIYDQYRCVACPPDSYADMDTKITSCQSCPMSRPSTFSVAGANSAQCSNEQLNRIRGLFFRYNTNASWINELKQTFNLSAKMWWNQGYRMDSSMNHLKPPEKYLEQQRQAVALFQAMTPLTFSNTELFILLIVSTGLAFYGAVGFVIILAATGRPVTCPFEVVQMRRLNWRERMGVAVYCFLYKAVSTITSIGQQTRHRLLKRYDRFRKSTPSVRLSSGTSNISRKFADILKQQYAKSRLPPLSKGQRNLIHLITRTTIDRIVEAAERDLNRRRTHERAIIEEHKRRRHDAGEIQAEARDAELAAETAKREAEIALQAVEDAKDGKAKVTAGQKAEKARLRAESLAAKAVSLRQLAQRRIIALNEFAPDEQLRQEEREANRWLDEQDREAVENAPYELRSYLRLPRYHTAEYFLLHPEMEEQAKRRKTAYPAPEREHRGE